MGRKKKTEVVETEMKEDIIESEVVEQEEKKEKKKTPPKTFKVVLSDKGSYLNLRKGAGTKYESIDHITEGEILEAAGEEVDAGDSFGWMPVKYKGKTGFVFSGKIKEIK